MPSYQYKKFHCGDKTVVRSSHLHNGISYTGKTTSLYWISALIFTLEGSGYVFCRNTKSTVYTTKEDSFVNKTRTITMSLDLIQVEYYDQQTQNQYEILIWEKRNEHIQKHVYGIRLDSHENITMAQCKTAATPLELPQSCAEPSIEWPHLYSAVS